MKITPNDTFNLKKLSTDSDKYTAYEVEIK